MRFLRLSGHLALVRTQQRSWCCLLPAFPGHIHTFTHRTVLGLGFVFMSQEACPASDFSSLMPAIGKALGCVFTLSSFSPPCFVASPHPFLQAQGNRVLDPAFWGGVHFEYYLPRS